MNEKEGNTVPTLKGSKTESNLKEAFAGESQANRRYLYFAQKADIEGYPDVAALFRSVAEGETGHAFGHFDFLREVGDPVTGVPVGATADNLKSAIEGETYEYTEMYPGSPGRRATRGSRKSPTGSRRWPAPRRATPVASPKASSRSPEPRRPAAEVVTGRSPGRRVRAGPASPGRPDACTEDVDRRTTSWTPAPGARRSTTSRTSAPTSAAATPTARQIIELKRRRRVAVGPIVSLVFENRETMRSQVQEMARAERMVTDEQIQSELDVYNALIPEPGELSATLFIELTEEDALRDWLPRLVGIERSVVLRSGAGRRDRDGGRSPCGPCPRPPTRRPSPGPRSRPSVHYVRFALDPAQVERFAAGPVALAVDHPEYRAEPSVRRGPGRAARPTSGPDADAPTCASGLARSGGHGRAAGPGPAPGGRPDQGVLYTGRDACAILSVPLISLPRGPLSLVTGCWRRITTKRKIQTHRVLEEVTLMTAPSAASWRKRAACQGIDPEVFYPVSDEDAEEAKAICAVCPVRQACLEHALAHREREGVWGGATERERRRILRQRRKSA